MTEIKHVNASDCSRSFCFSVRCCRRGSEQGEGGRGVLTRKVLGQFGGDHVVTLKPETVCLRLQMENE